MPFFFLFGVNANGFLEVAAATSTILLLLLWSEDISHRRTYAQRRRRQRKTLHDHFFPLLRARKHTHTNTHLLIELHKFVPIMNLNSDFIPTKLNSHEMPNYIAGTLNRNEQVEMSQRKTKKKKFQLNQTGRTKIQNAKTKNTTNEDKVLCSTKEVSILFRSYAFHNIGYACVWSVDFPVERCVCLVFAFFFFFVFFFRSFVVCRLPLLSKVFMCVCCPMPPTTEYSTQSSVSWRSCHSYRNSHSKNHYGLWVISIGKKRWKTDVFLFNFENVFTQCDVEFCTQI